MPTRLDPLRSRPAGPSRYAPASRLGPIAILLLGVAATTPPAAAQVVDADALEPALEWRHIGPVGNRVSAVAGVPGDPNVFFFGAASGGVWKSTDGGHSWDPTFDDQPVQSIGALAVTPSNPDIVWAGTGEPFIRSNVSHGDGIYRSTDGGESWEHAGLEESGRIARIVVHPENPDVVYVAALGHLYGPQQTRGVYRTRDGGRSWERVLFVDEETGASDIVMMPDDPDVLIAGMWTMLIRTWGRWSGGPNDGLYISTDGGDSWERLTGNGLPTGTTGKIGLAVTPADPDRVYALIETNANRDFAPETEPLIEHEGVLWRSDDRGRSWEMVQADHTIVQRPHYYTRAQVAPDDPDEIHFLATVHTRSLDGGETFSVLGGGDNHDMWIDPEDPSRMVVGNDQGVKVSTTRGEAWFRPLLPIAQMYHVAVDTEVPYNVYGNRQDGPSISGPSRVLFGGSIPIGEWVSVGGCESGWAVPDTVSNDVVWSGCYEGILDRHVRSTGHSRTVSVWPDNPEGWEAAPLRYRFQWTFPIHVSPHDPSVVYTGSQHVHRTTNGGQSWEVISPDLSTDDEAKQRRSGGLTPDDVSPTYFSVVFAIAESPVQEGLIWAGTNDGLVHVTRDGGGSWTDVTAAMPDLPPLGTVSAIHPSAHDAATAYVAVDLHQLGDFDPYLYRTDDYGASWTRIDGEIPRSTHSFTHVVAEDPLRPGLLYAGTHEGVWLSWDDGASWTSLQGELPHAPVSWLTVQPHFSDLVISTYGRGFWIMDDLTAIRSMTPEVAAAAFHLFEPRPAYRFLSTESPNSQPGDPAAGENARYGASIHYWLDDGADDVAIEILDETGEKVADVGSAPAEAGLNRAWWNLRFEGTRTPRIRMAPVEHAHAWPEAGGEGETRRPPEGSGVSILAPPGLYTVRVTADGRTEEQPLRILMDPASEGSVAGIHAQTEMLRQLQGELNRVADLIDGIEWTRLETRKAMDAARAPTAAADAASLVDPLETFAAELRELENELFDLRLTGGSAGQDALRWPRKLWAKIGSLAGYVSGTDHPPTDQAREVHALYQEWLAEVEARWREIVEERVPEVNGRLEGAGLTPITTAPPEAGDTAEDTTSEPVQEPVRVGG